MNKKIIVVVVLLLIVYFITKSNKATAQPVTQGNPESSPIYEDENFIFWDAMPYTVKSEDWLSKLAGQYISADGLTREAHKQALLDFTKSLALFNGFNWGLYDNVSSSDKNDPDTLYIGQVISLPQSYASKKMYETLK
jgi:hypothetical protein